MLFLIFDFYELNDITPNIFKNNIPTNAACSEVEKMTQRIVKFVHSYYCEKINILIT